MYEIFRGLLLSIVFGGTKNKQQQQKKKCVCFFLNFPVSFDNQIRKQDKKSSLGLIPREDEDNF